MSKYKVVIKSKIIAHKWWGQQWCKNIDMYADQINRLERGRTYIRTGRVHDINIENGHIDTEVDGTAEEPYKVQISIEPLSDSYSKEILQNIRNISDMRKGFIPDDYKFLFTLGDKGLFPNRNEISMKCSCPDNAKLCKHIASVLYAIGSILDQEPLLLLQLRGIDVDSYIEADLRTKTNALLINARNYEEDGRLIEEDLISELFGIDIESGAIGESVFVNEKNESIEDIRTIVIDAPSKTVKKKGAVSQNDKPIKDDRIVIRQYDLDGTFIKQYETYEEASEKSGIPKTQIQNAVRGTHLTGGGFVWNKAKANSELTNIEPVEIEKSNESKPVLQYDLDGNFIAEYSSISEASKKNGIDKKGIRDTLKGRQKTSGGYVWKNKESKSAEDRLSTKNIEPEIEDSTEKNKEVKETNIAEPTNRITRFIYSLFSKADKR